MPGPPDPPSEVTRNRLVRQRRRDTKPEVEIRRRLHALGVRFRVDAPLEPGLRTRGDIVWRGRRVVVFVDGCFWHGCPQHATSPTANAAWWRAKLDANIARDRRAEEFLRERGWTVLRIWEHEDPDSAVERILPLIGRDSS
jgi:DNA mismatch endonuclease (patch repair protein)